MPKTLPPRDTNKIKIKDTLNTNLVIPADTLRYQARKIQVMIRRYDRLAVEQLGQFPVKGYIELLEKFDDLVRRIKANDVARELEKAGKRSPKANLGEGTPDSLGFGVSADNPVTR